MMGIASGSGLLQDAATITVAKSKEIFETARLLKLFIFIFFL
jgi:deoxyinosine 3'endonuclease (endonuclease V)